MTHDDGFETDKRTTPARVFVARNGPLLAASTRPDPCISDHFSTISSEKDQSEAARPVDPGYDAWSTASHGWFGTAQLLNVCVVAIFSTMVPALSLDIIKVCPMLCTRALWIGYNLRLDVNIKK